MKTRLLLQVKKWLALFLLPLLFMAVAVNGVAQTQPDTCNATVVTDKADYAPGESVVITGTGWKPGETVELRFIHIEPNVPEHSHDPEFVTADAFGDILFYWMVLEQELGTTFRLEAEGLDSDCFAETFFTDAQKTTTTLTSNNNASSYGENVIFNISVTRSSGVGNANTVIGNLKLYIDDNLVKEYDITAGNNSVTYEISTLSAGTYTIDAKFTGSSSSPGYDDSDATLTQVVGVKSLLVTATADNKEYDGTTNAVAHLTTDALSGDDVTAAYTSANFNNKNVGTNKTVTVNGISISGTDAANYTLTITSATTTANITAKPITGNFTADNKVYDGNTSAVVLTRTLNGVVSGDVVSLTGGTATFSDKNVGTGKTVTLTGATLSGTDAGNYTLTSVATTTADISKAALTVSITAQDKVYDATTAATVAVDQITGILLTDVVTATASNGQFDNKNVGTGKTVTADIATAGADAGNYSYNATATATASITPKAASVTAFEEMKYCGQEDPTFEGVIEGFIAADNVTATYTRNQGESVGSYTISATLSPSDILQNYAITYNTAPFTILGVSIDASASSTPVPANSNATLSATVTPAVSGVSVTFLITSVGYSESITVDTDDSGIASTTTGNLELGVYQVEATAGSGCATSIAYIPVYDASGSFVTGGGWIMSPAGALTADPLVVGKANFGFVSKYKKGSNQVDGNTEFQFHAGGINFKSTFHEAGSLVISGGKATYRGTGTVNGQSGYKFTLVALDGQWNGGTGDDKFRIKITDGTGGVIYDNGKGAAENSDVSTALGGGSIVIHEKKKSLEVEVLAGDVADNLLKAYPNPFAERVFFDMQFVNDGHAVLEIFDMRGAKLSTLFDKSVEAGMIYRLEYAPTDVVPGILIYRLVKDGEVTNGRLIYQKQR